MSFSNFASADASTITREVLTEYFAGPVIGDEVSTGKIFENSDKKTKKASGGYGFKVNIAMTSQNEDKELDGSIVEKLNIPAAGYHVGRFLNALGVDAKTMKQVEKAGIAFEKYNTAAAASNSPADNKKALAAAEELAAVFDGIDISDGKCFIEHYPKSTRTGAGGQYSATKAYNAEGWEALKVARKGKIEPGKNYLPPAAVPDGSSGTVASTAVADVSIDLDDDDDDE